MQTQSSALPNIEEHTSPATPTKIRRDSRNSQTEALQSAIKDMATRLQSLEQRDSDAAAHELGDAIPKLEKLETDVKQMQQEIERLNQQLSAQVALKQQQGDAESSGKNTELEVLDCTQVKS